MLLIISRETPNRANKLRELYKSLDARDIPYIVSRKCDPAVIKRLDIDGLIIPGARFRVKPYEIQPALDLELYYIHHFPNTPVLGICHGCQFLMVYYGGTLQTYDNDTLWTGSHEVKLDLSRDRSIFDGQEPTSKQHFYFHELPVAPPHGGVREIAWITKFRDGERRRACAFEFVKDRVYGVLFHPELGHESRNILYNFYDMVAASSSASSA